MQNPKHVSFSKRAFLSPFKKPLLDFDSFFLTFFNAEERTRERRQREESQLFASLVVYIHRAFSISALTLFAGEEEEEESRN